MKLRKGLKQTIRAALLLVLIGLIGCNTLRPVIIHPIEKSDFYPMPKGVSYTPEKDGYFVSQFYIDEVMHARVNK